MADSKDAAGGGIGFCGLLAIVFITLRLCGVIAWSWWWVLSPLWIPLVIAGAFVLLILAAAIVSTLLSGVKR